MYGVCGRPEAAQRLKEIEAAVRESFVRNSTNSLWETLKPEKG
jgi:hypothetical protein